MTLKIEVIARPMLDYAAMKGAGYKLHPIACDVMYADELTEFAGRNCYQSWDRPNPATATNAGYIRNTVHVQRHESILEHAHVVFLVDGISRSLLLELERHRHLSFSVLSQRYVDERKRSAEPVIPPLARGLDGVETVMREVYHANLMDYDLIVERLSEQFPDAKPKQIREAARAVMPNMTPTKAVISGNLRAWRHVLRMRLADGADAEIREFAAGILAHLRVIAPNVMADFEETS